MKPVLKYLTAVIAAFMVLCFANISAYADTGTIKFSYVGSGVEFRLYKLGDIDADRNVVLNKTFSSYSVDINDSGAAKTLASYISRDEITPDMRSITDNSFDAYFEGLSRGVYLIIGDTCTKNDKIYTALPVIVSFLNEKGSKNITVTGKYEYNNVPHNPPGGGGSPDKETTEVSVLKVWIGEKREENVTAQLLRDGEVYDEIVLSKKNNWRHTWSGLNVDFDWSVVEKTVSNYDVVIDKDGDVFVITNTYKPKETTTETTTNAPEGTTEGTTAGLEVTTKSAPTVPDNPDTPDEPDNPNTPDTPDNPDTPNTPDTPDSPDTPITPDDDDEFGRRGNRLGRPGSGPNHPGGDGENGGSIPGRLGHPFGGRLPQTGQLWWPVPIMSCMGMVFIIIGEGRKREAVADEG